MSRQRQAIVRMARSHPKRSQPNGKGSRDPRLAPAGSQVYGRDGALEALERFTDLYATGQLIEFRQVVDTIIAWGDEILAWHGTGRPSNGRLEGTNNLLQVLRRAHGFTNADNFAARGLLLT